MAYQVLARKWRPKKFSEIIGQKHVVQALTNAMNQNYLHHAYLLTGTRGVGKTTFARILAKCLNCESNISAEPCGACSNCIEVDAGRFPDLFEVDAASRTKVEETRELLDNVPYAPTKGRFKIYLIDEVHMLSGHSFNALLKTLEEPPAHVKFLLATTDPQRLPATVLSRCLQFHLNALDEELISPHLQFILDQENISYERPALTLLSRSANGSMRDALSLLDQSIAYGNGAVREQDVRAMLGITESSTLLNIIEALHHRDGDALHASIQALAHSGAQFDQALNELLSVLHQITLLQVIPGATSPEQNHLLQTLASQVSQEDIQLYYQIGLMGQRDLAFSPSPRIGFEMTLLRMLAFTPNQTALKSNVPEKLPNSEKKQVMSSAPPLNPEPSIQSQNQTLTEKWFSLLAKLNLDGAAKALAQQCGLKEYSDDQFHLVLHPKNRLLMQPQYVERINAAIDQHLQKPTKVRINIEDLEIDTANDLALRQKDQLHQKTEQAVHNDPNIQRIIQTFDATLIKESIKPQSTQHTTTKPEENHD